MSYIKRYFDYVFCLFAVGIWYCKCWLSWNGEYLDTDNYFHALRMIDWFTNPHFFEQKMWWSNYPFGEVSHWTGVIYIVWGILSVPFLFFSSVKDAVFSAGLFICPLFCVLSIIFLLKSLHNVLLTRFRVLVIVLLATQAYFMRTLIFYRPDHHALFVFFSVVLLYLTTLFQQYRSDKILKWCSFLCVISLWCAVEGVFLGIAFLGFLLFVYCFLGMKYDYLEKFSLWNLGGVSLCWLLNPCYEGWFHIDTGRLSFFYVMVMFCVWGSIYIAKYIKNKVCRVSLICGILGCSFFVFYLLGWLVSPIDEGLYEIFINRITEMKNIDIYTGAYPFFGVILGGFVINRRKKDEVLWYIYISLILYSVLAWFGGRFLQYSGFYSAIMIGFFIQDRFLDKRGVKGLVLFFVLLEYLSFVLNVLVNGNIMQNGNKAMLVDFNGFDKIKEGSVVADTFLAPSIVWKTNLAVVASPYHRNVEGIIDNHKILFSKDKKEVIELIKKHKVGGIFITEIDSKFYQSYIDECENLYSMVIKCNKYPDWLDKIKENKANLFKVNYDKL